MEKKTLLGNWNRFALLKQLHLYSLFEPTTIFLTSKMTYYILKCTHKQPIKKETETTNNKPSGRIRLFYEVRVNARL